MQHFILLPRFLIAIINLVQAKAELLFLLFTGRTYMMVRDIQKLTGKKLNTVMVV